MGAVQQLTGVIETKTMEEQWDNTHAERVACFALELYLKKY